MTHKKLMSVTIQCIKRKDNMSSLSTKEDARRMSPRKSAGQMPYYLARRNGQKKATHRRTMIAMQVLNQGRSQGGLQVVNKVGEPSHSEFQGEGKSGESDKSDKAKIGGEREEDTGL